MNTKRSDRKVREFLRHPAKRQRKTVTVERILPAPPETVFPQLCPSRELSRNA